MMDLSSSSQQLDNDGYSDCEIEPFGPISLIASPFTWESRTCSEVDHLVGPCPVKDQSHAVVVGADAGFP